MQVIQPLALCGYKVDHDTKLPAGQTDGVAISRRRNRSNLVMECKYHIDPSNKVGINEVHQFSEQVVDSTLVRTINQDLADASATGVAGGICDSSCRLSGRLESLVVRSPIPKQNSPHDLAGGGVGVSVSVPDSAHGGLRLTEDTMTATPDTVMERHGRLT